MDNKFIIVFNGQRQIVIDIGCQVMAQTPQRFLLVLRIFMFVFEFLISGSMIFWAYHDARSKIKNPTMVLDLLSN